MDLEEKRSLIKVFITPLFSCCPLVWMFYSGKLNNCIKRVHERALRLTRNGYQSFFSKSLEKDHYLSIHNRILQVLVIEMLKIKIDIAFEIIEGLFVFKEPSYNLSAEGSSFFKAKLKQGIMVYSQLVI